MDKTPNQYIQWRFQYGEDKEHLAKDENQLSDAEKKALEQKIVIDGEKRVMDMLVGRRKLKKSYEYEIKWMGLGFDKNTWMPRDKLEKLGFEKTLQRFDDKEAARATAYTRPLTAKNIEKHLFDVGLEAEFATHSKIRGLSGGQKVKVVLGAAMWNNPHMIVMDEPTNYLDRESLGGLASAIKEFGGGVLIISHNREFTSQVCPETWNVNDGILTIEGQIPISREKIEQEQKTETFDAMGNVVKVKETKLKMSRKEIKVLQKKIKDKMAAGVELDSDEEDYYYENMK
jgi:elongation factor 3